MCHFFSLAPDGVYYLKSTEKSKMYPVYCHMSSLPAKCGGGGWTLVMKLDRDKVKHITLNSAVAQKLGGGFEPFLN